MVTLIEALNPSASLTGIDRLIALIATLPASLGSEISLPSS